MKNSFLKIFVFIARENSAGRGNTNVEDVKETDMKHIHVEEKQNFPKDKEGVKIKSRAD